MRNFKVTVNGNTYDVTVEEAGVSASSAQSHVAPIPVSAPAQKSSANAVGEGSIIVKAHMP